MMELEALQTVLPQIRELGASLVAISPQRPSYGRAVRRQAALEVDVLSDEGLTVAQAFGLVFTLPSYLENLYRSFGKTLDTFHGEPAYRLPLPARYVVDRQEQIRAADVNADYTVRPDPEETLAQLRGLSANSEHPAAPSRDPSRSKRSRSRGLLGEARLRRLRQARMRAAF